MSQCKGKRNWNQCVIVTGAVILLGIAGDIQAFAGESPAKQPLSAGAPPLPEQGVVATNPAASGKPGEVAGRHLLSREEMLDGMLQAEQRRSVAARPDAAIDNKAMLEKWGVQAISVSYAADGFWLAFRFRVADPEKARTLFDSRLKPYLESEASGVRMAVPSAAKVGALRTTDRGRNIQANKIYNIMFANPAFHVKPGQKVSVVVGNFKAEHMTVRGARENLSVRTARTEPDTQTP
jgi:hypothetical protein